LLDKPSSPTPASEPYLLNLKYKFDPRVNSSKFLLHASYIFTNPSPTKTNLLFPLNTHNLPFCPHVTSAKNCKGGQILPDNLLSQLFIRSTKERPKFEEVKTYTESCAYCWTDYQVSVCLRVVGVPRVVRVEFEFWHDLGDCNGDAKWDCFKPRTDDEECTSLGESFVKGQTRKLWENAGVLRDELEDYYTDEDLTGWLGVS
jgi:hypothetical protein